MRRVTLMAVLWTGTALARPTTGPVDVAPAPLVGQAVDPSRPAFVPRFAAVRHPLDVHFPEREYAFRFGYPAGAFFGGYGYGFGGYGFGGGGYGGYGFGGFGPLGGVTGFGTAGAVGGTLP